MSKTGKSSTPSLDGDRFDLYVLETGERDLAFETQIEGAHHHKDAPQDGNPGYYSAKFFLRPHSNLEEFEGLSILSNNLATDLDPLS